MVKLSRTEEQLNKARKIKFLMPPENLLDAYYKLIVRKESTYYLKNKMHCSAHRYRTIEDLYIINRTYFNYTLQDVVNFVNDFEKSSKNLKEREFMNSYCGVVKKNTYRWANVFCYSNNYKEYYKQITGNDYRD